MRRVEIVKRGRFKQKWFARFIAENGKTLAHTETYTNQQDVKDMLHLYYPDWQVKTIK